MAVRLAFCYRRLSCDHELNIMAISSCESVATRYGTGTIHTAARPSFSHDALDRLAMFGFGVGLHAADRPLFPVGGWFG